MKESGLQGVGVTTSLNHKLRPWIVASPWLDGQRRATNAATLYWTLQSLNHEIATFFLNQSVYWTFWQIKKRKEMKYEFAYMSFKLYRFWYIWDFGSIYWLKKKVGKNEADFFSKHINNHFNHRYGPALPKQFSLKIYFCSNNTKQLSRGHLQRLFADDLQEKALGSTGSDGVWISSTGQANPSKQYYYYHNIQLQVCAVDTFIPFKEDKLHTLTI